MSKYLDLLFSLNIYFKRQSELYISVYTSSWVGFLNMRTQTDKNLNINKINKSHHGKYFVLFYLPVEEYQLVNKNRTRAYSME